MRINVNSNIVFNEMVDQKKNLFFVKNDVIQFNEYTMKLLLNEDLNEENKKELLKLYMFYKLHDNFKEKYMMAKSVFLIDNYIEQVKEKLFEKVSVGDIKKSYHVMKNFFDSNKEYFNSKGIDDVIDELGNNVKQDEVIVNKYNLFFISGEKKNVLNFNSDMVESLLSKKLDEESKTQLTKLYIFSKLLNNSELLNNVKEEYILSDSMLLVKNYDKEIRKKLFGEVSKNFVKKIYNELNMYFKNPNSDSIHLDLGSDFQDTLLLKKNENIILNLNLVNKKMAKTYLSDDEKNQFALLYIMSKLTKLKDFKITLWDKEKNINKEVKIISVSEDNELQGDKYIKVIHGLSTDKLLNVIHNFFKGFILDDEVQRYCYDEVVSNLLRENLLQTGENKKELLVIDKNFVLFNEKNIKEKHYDNLLEAYVFYKIFKDDKELNLMKDKSINEMEKNISFIIKSLKNKISEKDIYFKIQEIEKKLEIETRKSYSQFDELSIELDAMNDVSFRRNNVVVFKKNKQIENVNVFINIDVVDRLLKKTIDSNNVKELVKLCLFSKLNTIKDGVLRDNKNNLILLADNCETIKEKLSEVTEKINGKVLDNDFNKAIKELNDYIFLDDGDDFTKRNVIDKVKKEVGISIISPFKHLL